MPFATPAARHQHLLRLLKKRGGLRVAGLSGRLGVTAMTIWRDLRLLEEQGLLTRVRGGAMPVGGSEPDFESKEAAAGAAKRAIAKAAVRAFVKDGDVIAIEGGTTCAALIEQLPEARVSVVTNSLPIALKLRHLRPGIPVHVAGGSLSAVSGNTVGPSALRALRDLRASVCFLSATGWTKGQGPSDPNPLEIETKRALAAISRRVILLLDSQKFDVSSTSITIHPRRLHAVLTNRQPPHHAQILLTRAGVQMLIAGHPGQKR